LVEKHPRQRKRSAGHVEDPVEVASVHFDAIRAIEDAAEVDGTTVDGHVAVDDQHAAGQDDLGGRRLAREGDRAGRDQAALHIADRLAQRHEAVTSVHRIGGDDDHQRRDVERHLIRARVRHPVARHVARAHQQELIGRAVAVGVNLLAEDRERRLKRGIACIHRQRHGPHRPAIVREHGSPRAS